MAKNVIEVPFSFIFPMLYTSIIYYISGFNAPIEHFLKFGKKNQVSCSDLTALLLINLTFCATGIGILIGCAFNELEVALNVAPLIFFPMLLFSGFYVNSDSVRSWVKWLEYISPIRYALEALVYNEFEGTKYSPNPINFLNF